VICPRTETTGKFGSLVSWGSKVEEALSIMANVLAAIKNAARKTTFQWWFGVESVLIGWRIQDEIPEAPMISPAPRRRTDALKPEQWIAATGKIVSEMQQRTTHRFAEYYQNIIYSTIIVDV
jgi:hypothetical protein